MHTILTGATGMVGSAALATMLANPAITRITILSRRAVPQAIAAADPRVSVILHDNFASYDADLRNRVKDAHGCVWAMGVSTTQVSDPVEYERITKTFPLAAAKTFGEMALEQGRPFNFVYVSASGVDAEEPAKSPRMWARVKGETERGLAILADENPLMHTRSFRTAFVDHAEHEQIKPYLPQRQPIMRVAEKVLIPALRVFWKSGWGPSEPLGNFLTNLAVDKYSQEELVAAGAKKIGDGDFIAIENPTFQKLAGVKP